MKRRSQVSIPRKQATSSTGGAPIAGYPPLAGPRSDITRKHIVSYIRALASIACILLLFTAGCDRGEPPAEVQPVEGAAAPIQFGRGRVTIETASDTFELGVEVAANEEQRSRGLMERQSLAADSGMIFLFQQPQPPTGVFWMFQTRIPLSIAFVGDDGRIGSIVEMEPCTSQFPQWCPNYEAGVPFVSALEVNAGYFRASNISVGDRVVLEQQ